MLALKPGIWPAEELSNKDYHNGPGISSSHIKELIKSPAHYQAWLKSEREETSEMQIGSAVHALLLEPNHFEKTFKIASTKDKRTKEYKSLVEQYPNHTILSSEQADVIHAVVESITDKLLSHEKLSSLFVGEKEKSFFWEDKETGVLCKCRPDILTYRGIITDIKVVRDASFDAFQKAIVDYGYFIQAPFYLDGVNAALGNMNGHELKLLPPQYFAFVAVEKEYPYEVAVYYLDEQSIHIGRQLYQKALRSFAECQKNNKWPGYERSLLPISIPNWALWKFNKPQIGVKP